MRAGHRDTKGTDQALIVRINLPDTILTLIKATYTVHRLEVLIDRVEDQAHLHQDLRLARLKGVPFVSLTQ